GSELPVRGERRAADDGGGGFVELGDALLKALIAGKRIERRACVAGLRFRPRGNLGIADVLERAVGIVYYRAEERFLHVPGGKCRRGVLGMGGERQHRWESEERGE